MAHGGQGFVGGRNEGTHSRFLGAGEAMWSDVAGSGGTVEEQSAGAKRDFGPWSALKYGAEAAAAKCGRVR